MEIHLVFDGGNGASAEKEAYGSFTYTTTMLSDKDYHSHIHRRSFGVGYTNNEAEYKILIAALEYLIDSYNPRDIILHIKGDSELIRNQIGLYIAARYWELSDGAEMADYEWYDVWQVKKQHLLPYRNKARLLLEQFKSFTYEHVPRKTVVSILGH